MDDTRPKTAPAKPEPITVSRRERNKGAKVFGYKKPRFNGRGDLLSPNAETKRNAQAAYEAVHGCHPTPRQLKRSLRELKAEQRAQELPRTDVLKGGGRAA